MPKKTPPCEHYDKWTTAKFWSFIRSGLRAKWTRWPPRFEALKEAKRNYTGDNKRQKYEYLCSQCKEWWMQKEVEVDHIEPCGTLKCYDDLKPFVQKLFVSKDKLRIVCKTCHKKLTQQEKLNKLKEIKDGR